MSYFQMMYSASLRCTVFISRFIDDSIWGIRLSVKEAVPVYTRTKQSHG